MDNETFSMCIIEKQFYSFYKRYSESKNCNRRRGLKRYYENKDKKWKQQKICEKKIEINFSYRNKTIDVYKLMT